MQSRVVVSCAGSGKTQQIINRLLRLLAEGAKPGEILVITFTNKAAAEIRERLLDTLKKIEEDGEASSPGLEPFNNEERQKLITCRREILLAVEPADMLSVHTFHSWFLILMQHRPFNKDVTPPIICADQDIVFEQSWRRFVVRVERGSSPVLDEVLAQLSPSSVKKMCKEFKDNRNAFWLWRKEGASGLFDETNLEDVYKKLRAAADEYAQRATGETATLTKAIEAAERLAKDADPEAEQPAFLTKQNKPKDHLQKQADNGGYSQVFEKCCESILEAVTAKQQKQAEKFNVAALSVCEMFNEEWEAVLRQRNEVTFDGLEWQVHDFLQNEKSAQMLSLRMYTRYRHFLIDEFQDTSPMQWQIISRWLLDSHGSDMEPSVFIVGDPKQAIYAFRRSDSRLLELAQQFLNEHYGVGEPEHENTCRRCGENILELVNKAFDDKTLPDFKEHQVGGDKPAGRVEWHTWHAEKESSEFESIRNPLITGAPAGRDRPTVRAKAVAERVNKILQEWGIHENGTCRPCRPEDILILMPQMTHAAVQVSALAEYDIKCTMSKASGGNAFTDSFECADVLDLIAVLLAPRRDSSLARVLKSPIFSLSDETLEAIVAEKGESLWEKLQEHDAVESKRAREQLLTWRQQAETSLLPAHDFLAELYASGDIVARYCASVPPTMRQRVEDNLLRLLDLSLQLEGGSHPLLSQFWEGVRRRDNFGAPPPAESGVRLMTIHAAKGLQSPVVVLADADFNLAGGKGNSFDIVMKWEPEEKAPSLFAVALRQYPLAYKEIKEDKALRREKEQANLFYVALTRAQQALMVFSSEERKNVTEKAFSAMRQLSPDGDTVREFGDILYPPPEKQQPSPVAAHKSDSVKPVVAGQRQERMAMATHGQIRHQIIALLLSDVGETVARQLVAAEESQWKEAKHMLASPELQKLLNRPKKILVERDFAIDGKITRPDLVIVREDETWVVDYKTGDAVTRHRPQLENYRRVVAKEYPDNPVHIAVLTLRGQLHCLDSAES